MRRRIVAAIVAVSAIGVFAAVGLGSAYAAPSNAANAGTVSADCGADGHLDVTVNFANNGTWSPAFVEGTNQVFHPTAFGPSTGTFTDPAGNVYPAGDPGGARVHTPQNGAHVLNCTYHIEFTFSKGGTLVLDGTVTGYLTPPNA